MSMYRIFTLAAGLFTIMVTSQAYAQDDDMKFYVGLEAGRAELTVDTNIGDLEEASSNFGIKLGREILPFFNVETHFGLNDKGPSEVYYAAAFGRLQLPFERVNVYALGGFSFIDYEIATPPPERPLQDDESEIALGVGIELYGSDTNTFYLQAMQYGDDVEYRTYSVGFSHRFNFPGFR